MFRFIQTKIALFMLGIIMVLLACIPREEPEASYRLAYIRELPAVLQENSGMTELGNLIWFINDGGNEPALYGYSMEQDAVLRTVVVRDVVNTDWEDIVQNENYLFIGDFGNNSGDRTNLRIHIIRKSELLEDTDTITMAGTIAFSYSDQTSFTPQVENTPFDCEAFIATRDSLYLFTKNWQEFETRIYSLSIEPETQVAKLRTKWSVPGLVTAAAWAPDNQELLLLGYTPLIPFIRVYTEFSPDNLTYQDRVGRDFGDFWGTQTEGILISSDNTVYISSEGVLDNNASLYRLEFE
ncbi:MAG: hypothetical protein JW830_01815 [Bacteroidales bacterium]|nr:hypothetical protein [Bacteroidales bacterium]